MNINDYRVIEEKWGSSTETRRKLVSLHLFKCVTTLSHLFPPAGPHPSLSLSLKLTYTHTHTHLLMCIRNLHVFRLYAERWIYTTSQMPVQQIEDLFTSWHEVFAFLLSHISFSKAHLTSCLLLFSYFCTLLPIWTKNLPWYMVFPFS